MPALSHVGLGLAAKRATPQIPVLVLILATLALDILAGVFWMLGVIHIMPAGVDTLPWSHSLVMTLPWSVITAILVMLKYRNLRAGVVIGLLVFSHWLLDFIMWQPTVSLLYAGGPETGLYLSRNMWTAVIFEFGVLLIGILIYLRVRGTKAQIKGGE